jgi:hypothetical protein
MIYEFKITYDDTSEDSFEDARVMDVHLNAKKYQLCLWNFNEELIRMRHDNEDAACENLLDIILEKLHCSLQDYNINLDVP